MDDHFSQQLKKGALELLVLSLLCQRPAYGYELLYTLKERSRGLFTLKEGTLYPILYRLEDDGYIVSAWSSGEGRSTPKKIYEPTDAGRAELQRRTAIWRDHSSCVNQMLKEDSYHV